MSNELAVLSLFMLFLLAACTPTTSTGNDVELAAPQTTPDDATPVEVENGMSASLEITRPATVISEQPLPNPTTLVEVEPILTGPFTATILPPLATPAPVGVPLSWRNNPNSADLPFYQSLSDEIDAANDTFTLTYAPQEDASIYRAMTLAEIAAGMGPDVFWLPAEELAAFVEDGLLLDLRPFATPFNPEAFYPGPMYHLTYDPATNETGNVLWGLPSEVNTLVLYLNLDLIAAAGAPDPRQLAASGNWNWDTFLQVAQVVNDPANGVYGYEQPWWWGSYGTWMNAAGGGYWDADGCGIDSAESLVGLEFAHNLYQQAQVAVPYEQNSFLFLAGQAGMFQSDRSLLPTLNHATFNWDVVELPTGLVSSGNWLFWGAYVVNRYTQHPKEAWELAQALTSEQSQMRLAELETVIPSRLDGSVTYAFLSQNSQINNQAFLNGVMNGGTAVSPAWNNRIPYDDFSCSSITHLLNGELSLADYPANACKQFTQASITICP